jgi:hypothetical protein
MAAAGLAVEAGTKVAEFGVEKAQELAADPWGTSSRWLIEAGIVASVVGGAMWLSGDVLVNGAKAADADAGRRISAVGQSFANATPPSDGSNGWGIFGVVVGDIQTALGDIGSAVTAITDIPHAIWAAVQAFPYLLWDSFAYSFGMGLGWIGVNLGPYLFGFGILMIAVGVMLRVADERLFPRIELAFNARTAEFWNAFDRRFKTRRHVQQVWTQKSTEGLIDSANTNPRYEWKPKEIEPPTKKELDKIGKDAPVAPPVETDEQRHQREHPDEGALGPPEPVSTPGESIRGPYSPPAAPEGVGTPPPSPEPAEPEPEPPEPFPAAPGDTDETGGTEEKPLPLGTPTSEVEEGLGGHRAIEPDGDELRAMEEARRETHPEPETLEPLPPKGMTDTEYFAQVDRLRLDNDTTTYPEAADLYDEKTRIIEDARATRREAKVRMDALGKKGYSKRQYRGFMQGGDSAAMDPETFGD